MTRHTDKASAVITTVVHPDHEVITPPDTLGERVVLMARADTAAKFEAEALANAEKELAKLSHNFNQWILSETDRLEEARQAYSRHQSEETLAVFYRISHDIRGHAATLGFPHASDIAEGLCLIVEKIQGLEGMTLHLIFAHVDALRTGVSSQISGDKGASLLALKEELRAARHAKFGAQLDPV